MGVNETNGLVSLIIVFGIIFGAITLFLWIISLIPAPVLITITIIIIILLYILGKILKP